MSAPAQITICGALGRDHIAQLVDIALSAGAALMVQPRAIASPTAVVEASPRPKALPPARARVNGRKSLSADASIEDRVRHALQGGPSRLKDLLRGAKVSTYQVRQLVDGGVIVATGVTNARRYALPGYSAKEAP